jgi:hypothetical protein
MRALRNIPFNHYREWDFLHRVALTHLYGLHHGCDVTGTGIVYACLYCLCHGVLWVPNCLLYYSQPRGTILHRPRPLSVCALSTPPSTQVPCCYCRPVFNTVDLHLYVAFVYQGHHVLGTSKNMPAWGGNVDRTLRGAGDP